MRKSIIFAVLCFLCVQFVMAVSTGSGYIQPGKEVSKATLNAQFNMGMIPLYFVPNKGQYDMQATFYARASRYTLWATAEGLIFDSIKANKRDVSRMVFLNAKSNPEIVSNGQKGPRINYFTGEKSHWRTDLTATEAILYKNVYNQIDLKVYGIEKEVEYDWIIKANGNPADVCFAYQDVLGSRIDEQGNISVRTNFGPLIHKRPFGYQIIDGQQKEVQVSFKEIKKNVYGFNVGAYDKSRELVIDPAVLVYSTYFGGSRDEYVSSIAGSPDGLVYMTGGCTYGTFPVKNAFDSTADSYQGDAWVSVIDTTKTGFDSLLYSTYMGDDGNDMGYGIQVDASGIIYVTGNTWDQATPFFPTTDGSSPSISSGYNVFAAKMDISLSGSSQLLYSTIFGGSGDDKAKDISYDSYGNIYVCGVTSSPNSGSYRFPISTNAYRSTKVGTYELYVAKIVPPTGVSYCTYIGGGSNPSYDEAAGDVDRIAVDSRNYIYLVATTRTSDYPVTTGALKSSLQGLTDGVISIFDPTATIGTNSLLYSTYFGGTSNVDTIWEVVIAGDDHIYITGDTESNPGTGYFPITTNAYDTTRNGGQDGYVAIMDFISNQLSITYCTYFGGSSTDYGRSLTIDANGYIYLCGKSTSTNLPYVNAYQSCISSFRSYAAIIDPTLGVNGLLFSTCLGGTSMDTAYYIGYDNLGRIMIGGYTTSSNYPLVNPYQSSLLGGQDMFVSLIDPQL